MEASTRACGEMINSMDKAKRSGIMELKLMRVSL
jgi:hypothetical protein